MFQKPRKPAGASISGKKMIMPPYDPSKIEPKWRKKWAASKIYKSTENPKKDKFYVLDMFPYPSGEGLHVGHPKGYIATDIVSRMKRMQGHSVLHPMGFDAFGLPAENYAIKTKTNPRIAVAKNVTHYKEQLEILGFDYDWSREVNTTDPKYYKWTQWIFLQLFKKGLAYESYEPINWCPSCKTGLANEDVENGRCERCGTPVEKKPLRQWVLKITDYADRLLRDLDAELVREFTTTTGSDAFRPDMPISERYVVHCLIKHWSENKFLCMKWKKNDWRGYVVGGIEKGESVEQTAVREVREETGYKNVVFKKIVGGMTSRFYQEIKQQNRVAHVTTVYLELTGGAQNEIPKEEKEIQDIEWVPFEKVRDFVNRMDLKYEWDLFTGKENQKALLDWPESIKTLQRNWIGKSEGMIFASPVKDTRLSIKTFSAHFEAFCADTFVVIAPDHPFLKTLVAGTPKEKEVLAFADEIVAKRSAAGYEEREPEGIFTGRYTVDPVGNGELPIWVASFALADYGTGIIKCSAHDQRDFAFAEKYNIKLKAVLFPSDQEERKKVEELKTCFTDMKNGILTEPKEFNGKKTGECKQEIIKYLEDHDLAKKKTTYKLRDWVFSRQRYWGEPIPVVHCPQCAFDKYEREVKLSLSFYYNPVWKALKDGTKTVETRALNPEEKERYFGDLKIGDIVRCSFKNEKTKKIKAESLYRIKSRKIFKSLDELFDDKGTLSKLHQRDYKSPKDLEESYASFGADYVEKIRKNGLIAWEIEPVTVAISIPEKDLPVTLPKVKYYEPTGTGESPLAAIDSWVNVKCPVCKGPAKRETNTMPQWAGSSWYYLRYEDPKNAKKLVDPKKEKYWSPVDLYVGGAEHATRHLIYARFWHKFLYDIGAVSMIEPFMKLQHVGLIMGEDGRKMSKRFGNVVNPDEIVKTYGADTLRIYEMFMGPFDQQIAWNTNSIIGARRFIERVWKLSERVVSGKESERRFGPSDGEGEPAATPASVDGVSRGTFSETTLKRLINKTVKKVTGDIESMRFNTAISSLMIALNELEKVEMISRSAFEAYLKLLAPFAPHVTEELWMSLGNKKSIHISPWPEFDPNDAIEKEATLMVHVNGKVRGQFTASVDTPEESLKTRALAVPEVKKWLEGKTVKKVIVVKGRLVSVVVS